MVLNFAGVGPACSISTNVLHFISMKMTFPIHAWQAIMPPGQEANQFLTIFANAIAGGQMF